MQELANFEDYKGKSLTCFAWMKTNVSNKYRIQIWDGTNSSKSKRHSGRGAWQLLQASHKVNPSAKFLKIRIIQAAKTGNVEDVLYIDGALLVEGDWDTFYHYKLYKNKSKYNPLRKDVSGIALTFDDAHTKERSDDKYAYCIKTDYRPLF